MNIGKLQTRIYNINKANGWFDGSRNLKTGLALIITEICEAIEEVRIPNKPMVYAKVTDGFGETGEFEYTEELIEQCGRLKPLGVGSEVADIAIRCMDELNRNGDPTEESTQIVGLVPPSSKNGDLTFWYDMVSLLTCPRQNVNTKCFSIIEALKAVYGEEQLESWIETKLLYNEGRGYRHGNKTV